MATLAGSDFDPIKWAQQGFYFNAEGRRAHLLLVEGRGTCLISENDADAEAYAETRRAVEREY
jgi:hypothetical protein